MRDEINFQSLAQDLLRDASRLLFEWLPGGKIVNREYCCGSIRGEAGQSLKVNLDSGLWADFADNERGGDLISLYAAINGLSQIDAAKKLSERVYQSQKKPATKNHLSVNSVSDHGPDLIPPPKGTRLPSFTIPTLGEPAGRWLYRTAFGEPLFFVTRYNLADSKKEFRPWSFSKSLDRWVNKYPPSPRPLYNLDQLSKRPTAPVLIVEGEKSADAASALLGSYYVCVTWAAGGKSWSRSDWSPINGRHVLIWPDSDAPGISAASDLARHLYDNGCVVKLLDVVANGGWDIADARDEGFDTAKAIAWAKQRARVYEPPRAVSSVEVIPPQPDGPLGPRPPDPAPPAAEQHVHVYTDADSVPSAGSSSYFSLWTRAGASMTSNGQLIVNADNAARLLRHAARYRDRIFFDSFTQDIFYRECDDAPPRPWIESDTLNLLIYLQSECGASRMTEQAVTQAVRFYAHQNERDTAVEWFESLKWDGQSRIDFFLHTHAGAENNEYTLHVSKNLFLSIVARVLKPGCQVDTMVILEGRQGALKSSLLRALGGEWYLDLTSEFGSKDFFEQLRGKIVVEASELDLFRRSDVNTLKRVLSCPVDNYRPPYAVRSVSFKRRCVFIGTTNQDDYLLDETGNRRFWPVEISKIDLGMIRADREQLFAEAVARVKNGEEWWYVPPEMAVQEQSKRRDDDPWLDIVADYVLRSQVYKVSGVTVRDIALNCLKFDESRISRTDSFRIGRVLRQIGFKARVERRGGLVARVFRNVENNESNSTDQGAQ